MKFYEYRDFRKNIRFIWNLRISISPLSSPSFFSRPSKSHPKGRATRVMNACCFEEPARRCMRFLSMCFYVGADRCKHVSLFSNLVGLIDANILCFYILGLIDANMCVFPCFGADRCKHCVFFQSDRG